MVLLYREVFGRVRGVVGVFCELAFGTYLGKIVCLPLYGWCGGFGKGCDWGVYEEGLEGWKA